MITYLFIAESDQACQWRRAGVQVSGGGADAGGGEHEEHSPTKERGLEVCPLRMGGGGGGGPAGVREGGGGLPRLGGSEVLP